MTTAYKTFIRMSVHIEKQHRQKCWRAKEIRDEKKNATAQLIWDQFQISVDGLTDDKSRRREHLRPVFRLHHSPEEAASALGGSSSSSPLGMPSAVDSTSRSRRNSSSDGTADSGAQSASDLAEDVFEDPDRARFSMVSALGWASISSSVVGATPISLPRASPARAWHSLRLGNSCKSLRPKRIRNSFEDL